MFITADIRNGFIKTKKQLQSLLRYRFVDGLNLLYIFAFVFMFLCLQFYWNYIFLFFNSIQFFA